jgi:hypothetical protein
MKRREFLQSVGLGLSLTALPGTKLYAAENDYQGKFLVTLRANGGWDTTAFCDPKENVPGERIITHWSETQQTRRIGNINYSPFGINEEFFQAHYRKMMVVNGINGKTNSHSGGREKMNTGGSSAPSVSGLFAAVHGADQSLPWLVDALDRTWDRGLLVRTKVSGGDGIGSLVQPAQKTLTDSRVSLHDSDVDLIRGYLSQRNQALNGQSNLLPRTRQWIEQYSKATIPDERLTDLTMNLQNVPAASAGNNDFNEKIAFVASSLKAGVSLAGDISVGGFDTHNNSDDRQTSHYSSLLNGANYLWELAEFFGFDDRLIVQIESDFGRTPHYNDRDGKDHWSVGSKVFMEKNAVWNNRQLGGTDEGLKAKTFDPMSLNESASGMQIEPKHVNHAFRDYLGLNTATIQSNFEITGTFMPFFV